MLMQNPATGRKSPRLPTCSVGYFDYLETGYEGGLEFHPALLVVDEDGAPIEFCVCEPVRITEDEQILYGARLKPVVLGQRAGEFLCRRLKRQLDLVAIQDRALLELARVFDPPVVCISLQAGALDEAPGDVTGDDYTLTGAGDRIDEASRTLERLAEVFPLLEPFERVRRAVARLREAGSSS